MKKILIGAALAGAIVGGFASISFAAQSNGASPNIITADRFCGPYSYLQRGFHDRYGRWIPPRCVREHVYRPYSSYPYYDRPYYRP